MQTRNSLQNELLVGTDRVESGASYQAFFQGLSFDSSVGNAIFCVDERVSLIYATDKFYKILGYSKEEYEVRALLFLRRVHEETGTYVLRKANRLAQNEGKEVVNSLATTNFFGQEVRVKIGVRFIEKVSDKSYYQVTMSREGKEGRDYDLDIDQFLRKASTKENHAVMVIKVGNLDHCYQNYGRKFADTLVREIYQELRCNFRQTDFVEQISKNEFLIFMKRTNEMIASRKAEDISLMISSIYSGETNRTALYSNVGISYFPYDGVDFENLFICADSACLCAEEEGQNHICAYEEHMKSYYRKREDNYAQDGEPVSPTNLDSRIISFAFGLLADTQDLRSTINLLLEQIGNYYDLSSITVLERNEFSDLYETVNYWKRGVGIVRDHGDELCAMISGEEEFLMEGFYCEEGNGDFSSWVGEILRKAHMKSFLCSNFNGEWFGNSHVIFNDGKRKRTWSEKEKATMHELARLISSYSLNYKKQESSRKEIENLRMRDPLTGLLNRDAFIMEGTSIYDCSDEGTTYAVVYSDINGFEYVNTSFGQELGDHLLRDYGHDLDSDRSVLYTCRVYSDCFLTLWKGKNPREVLDQLNDSNHAFLQKVKKVHPLTNLSIATGVCYLTRQDFDKRTSLLELIENANMARKEAKTKNGTHTIIYNTILRERLEREQQIAAKLEDAMHKGNIELFLQPKFSLGDRKVVGAEALVRWKKEDGTYALPMEFIPSLERIGFIRELDFYMFEQTLKHMKKWKLEGKKLFPISVNFSRMHTQSDDFVRQVVRLTDYYDVDRNLIEIEITESMLSDDSQRMLDDMDQLQKAGFKVDIDDFGTGYSSLNMLLRAPVDIVKLDKSFLSEVADSERQRGYLKCIAELIAAADKEIIFEGVETEYQAKLISDFGYDKVQGFLFGKPISARDFEVTYMLSNIELLPESFVG